MRRWALKLPEDIRKILTRRFQNRHRHWLRESVSSTAYESAWPLEIHLGIPTEQEALRQPEGVRAWALAWRSWQGSGSVAWIERRWRSLGTQSLPEKLRLDGPDAVAMWAGETARWSRAVYRFKAMVMRWPVLIDAPPRHFGVLADYDDSDFLRLTKMVSWIGAHPNSNLYPRQIPVAGVDSKWLESRKGLVSELLATIQGDPSGDRDFFRRCGLRPQPQLIRIRILDPELRRHLGGLGDVSAPWEEVANTGIQPTRVFIVENLQTGLAFEELAGAVVIMGLGYGVEVLGRIPWLPQARCLYWGDIDTHGFAILNCARTYLPTLELESMLMDEATLLSHRELWVEEKDQHASIELPLLTRTEQDLFRSLKSNAWGQQVRLEQERIRWDVAWKAIQAVALNSCNRSADYAYFSTR